MNKKALFDLSYGVYVVSTKKGDGFTGCIANSAMQITSSPASIAVSVNHDNLTNSCIRESGVFAVSVLPENVNPFIIGQFGFKSARDCDKFSEVEYEVRGGIAIPSAAKSFIVCKVCDVMETSTHTVFLGEVTDADVLSDETPMTYAYYHNVKKGKSPKAAPTYLPEEAEQKAVWKCSVCGYVYNGETPFEELPDDYVCPLCGVSKSMFKKQ